MAWMQEEHFEWYLTKNISKDTMWVFGYEPVYAYGINCDEE